MKVGTDAVLLGAWAGNRDPNNILDIGTGSGIVSLMMAQRFRKAEVLGIDIHPGSVEQANENFRISAWAHNLKAKEVSLQDHIKSSKLKYDLIVSNPPFFKDSLLPPDPSRTMARHTGTLSYEELVRCSAILLQDEGSLALILPYENKAFISGIMKKNRLYLKRELNIIPVRGKEPNRFLSEWGFSQTTSDTGDLTIRLNPNTYTEEYKELTREFYLAL